MSKERERSSEYEGIEAVRSKEQEVYSEDEEDDALSRKELSNKGRRKGEKPTHDKEQSKERPKGKKVKFAKDESLEEHSEPEEVVREKSRRKKKETHGKGRSVKGDGDNEVCEKRVRKRSKKREVNTESESETSTDDEETECSSFEDDTSHKESSRKKPVTKRTELKVKVKKEYHRSKTDVKSCDIQYSDEVISTEATQRSREVETESEEESSSSDEEEIDDPKKTEKYKHTETQSAARTKGTTQYEKGKTSGKKRVSLKPQSATTKASPCPEQYKGRVRKKEVTVDEKEGKSTYSKETHHQTS